MAGLYCCWAVKIVDNGFYLSAINAKYLKSFYETYGKLTLLSTTTTRKITDNDVFISNEICNLIELPNFSNYISSLKFFFPITKAIHQLCEAENKIYIKTPEPFCWYFAFFKKNKIINYHFVSNPIQVILNNKAKSIVIRLIRFFLYYPEYMLTCLAAYFCNSSGNGCSVINNIPFFLRKKTKVLIESSLTEQDFQTHTSSKIKYDGLINFLAVSRLYEGKGLELLINTFKKLNDYYPSKKFHLTIVGDGPLKKSLINLINTNKLNSLVTLLGEVPNGNELNEVYSSNEVFINPSSSETGPRVILEAMSQSLFCITTDVGYVNEVMNINGSCCGKIIPINSEIDLLSSILWTFDNPQELKNLSLLGKQYARNFKLSDFVEKIFS
ncbi:glycosyltransferase [Providencia sp. CRE-3FA-0001]|uniref:Glycosyltransferase n=1 Tax=Providencia huashanensis TaxID=3037798 RepID=A0AA42JVB6_9GAMM|nr:MULTISPECIES: glycosyltransferase [unclassified Providencia]MDG4696933.1 glycosyltransferase [Providencia sp. CRE-3FA-0001]